MRCGVHIAFVDRQKHIKTDTGDFYIDFVKGEDDNPTIGVLLCTETDNTIAKYSVLHESEQLFAAKYMSFMPTEEELRRDDRKTKTFHYAFNLNEFSILIISSLKVASIFNRSSTFEQL